jgi:hypothetical protein
VLVRTAVSLTARGLEGTPAAATAEGYGPDLLGRAVEALEELAEVFAFGAAGDRGAVATSGFRRYWGWKSRRRRCRPMISTELRDLIRRMSRANPLWGAPRIHGELLKLGLTVSQATVSKYVLRHRRPPSQAWRALFTVPTATFRVLFVLIVLSHGRRRLVHFNVTEHPTAEWTARQLIEACGREESARHLIRDRDQLYGERFSRQANLLEIREPLRLARRGKTPMRSG